MVIDWKEIQNECDVLITYCFIEMSASEKD